MARDRNRRDRRSLGPPKLSRADYLPHLAREPVLWDVLFFWLARDLGKEIRTANARMPGDALRFAASEQVFAGALAARAFEGRLRQCCARDLLEGRPYRLTSLDASSANELAQGAAQTLASVLGCYHETIYEEYIPQRHPNVKLLVSQLVRTIADFLTARCLPGGDLHRSLESPLASHDGFFTGQHEVRETPLPPSGDLNRDVYRLGVVVEDTDGPIEFKRKLISFTMTDPWLIAARDEALDIAVQQGIDNSRSDEDREELVNGSVIEASDRFMYSHLVPLDATPVEHWIAQQPLISQAQRDYLIHWTQWEYTGTFKVLAYHDAHSARALDVRTGRELTIAATVQTPMSQIFSPGDYLRTRILPDAGDRWLLSGATIKIGALRDPLRRKEFERDVRRSRPTRRLDRNDPLVQRSFEESKFQYDAWVELFGTDEKVFANGLDAAAALSRFYRYITYERVHPKTGAIPAQLYAKEHGHEPPEMAVPRLPQPLLEADDVSILVDPEWGTHFLVGHGQLLEELGAQSPPRTATLKRLRELIVEEDVDWWVIKRLGDRFPQRLEQMIRLAMGDPEFAIEELDALLHKFKGDQLRIGPIPSTTAVATKNSGEDDVD